MVGSFKEFVYSYSRTTPLYANVIILLLLSLLVVVSFLIIKKKGKKEEARRILQELILERRKVTPSRISRIKTTVEEKKRVSLIHNVVLYEAFFVVGIIISIIGYISRNMLVIILGIIAMVISLPLLEIVLRKRLEQDPEEEILRKADWLIKKERELLKKEKEIKVQIEKLYDKAARLMAVEKEVERLKTKTTLPEEEVKRVLRVVDEMLEKLPEEEIDKFLRSEDFELYQRIMKRVK